ncbi:unnamed protein product [Mesocestoides corti]|uniref:Ribosomal_L30 domain-containing protein n=1 Tax=Mesocestoides corti TaxID=53468 RepID=A0A0R3UKI0_MESCO|nr:unnamed protein product [Mesocestoides corti]
MQEERIGDEKKLAKLPTVPIKLLKRRKQTNKDVIKQQRKRLTEIRKRAKQQKSLFRRPAHFISVARKEARDEARIERASKRKPPIAVNERLGIIIRIHGDTGLSLEATQVLRLLRLTGFNQAVFVKVSQAMLQLLTVVQPYIVWGYADLATVRNLIFKRGKTQVGSKIRSIDNAIVEEKLGSLGILCIEDIIHELITLGPHLREVLGFLCPFKVMPPTGGWRSNLKKCQHPFNHLAGNRDDMISQLIHKMV